MITQERVKELFEYNPLIGDFVRTKTNSMNTKIGETAGTELDGYVSIFIDNKGYPAHKLAWLYMTGEYPNLHIDHIDGNRMNNKMGNLRLVTNQENAFNRSKPSNNTSGYKGVVVRETVTLGKRYVAQIGYNGKMISCGTYDTAEEAHKAYCTKANELFGDYANAG